MAASEKEAIVSGWIDPLQKVIVDSSTTTVNRCPVRWNFEPCALAIRRSTALVSDALNPVNANAFAGGCKVASRTVWSRIDVIVRIAPMTTAAKNAKTIEYTITFVVI